LSVVCFELGKITKANERLKRTQYGTSKRSKFSR